jgi:hypothetical protein
MKTDAEIEAEERERAEREVQRLGARGGGFTPLAGMTRRKLEVEKEGTLVKAFGIGAGAVLVILLGAWLAQVMGAGAVVVVIALVVVGLLIGIFVRLGKR